MVATRPGFDSDTLEQATAGLNIRRMQPADVTAVAVLEAQAYPFPWSETIFADCLRAGYNCQVLEHSGRLLGYAVLTAVLDEAHLLNICVSPAYQRHGFGRRLLLHVCRCMAEDGRKKIFLEVRPSNQAALSLYQQCEFEIIGQRRGYYPAEAGREDAIVLQRKLDGLAATANA